jgi:trans-2,3-dihydro-3-hydroxyanthranilate isomerase
MTAELGHDVCMVDVFVDTGWGGQPVAVSTHEGSLDEAAMKATLHPDGAQMAFVDTTTQPHGLRVFRMGTEVPFSGAAAIGAAWVLRQQPAADRTESVTLAMPIGDVHVSYPTDSGETAPLWLAAPTITLGSPWPGEQIYGLLGLQRETGVVLPPVQMTSLALPILLVPVAGLQALGTCQLAGPAFKSLAVQMVRHLALHLKVYVFCQQARNESHHVAARMFRPGDNGPQDVASGAGAACLGAYLLQHRLLSEDGELLIEQGHETGRPSLLRLRSQSPIAGPGIEVGGAVRETLTK